MARGEVILQLADPADPALEGRTFQVHLLPDGRLRLYPVEIMGGLCRCPVLLAGERCGRVVGHEGKHCWASGD
jgi:hypothetical protein